MSAAHDRRLPTRDAIEFRTTIIDAIVGPTPRAGEWLLTDRFWNLGPDHLIGVCPVCDSSLGVRFHGTAARADLNCHRGCVEAEVIDAIRARRR